MRTRWTLGVLTLGLALAWSQVAWAEQAPTVKRSVLQKKELRAPGYEGVMAAVEIPAGGREGRHTHPAEVFAQVLEGTLTLEVEGQPTATLKPGETFFIGAGKVHEGINQGSAPVKLLAVFVAEKGKPLTAPAQ